MKIVFVDDDRFYCYGLHCLINKVVSVVSEKKPKFFWSWRDIDDKTDYVFLSDRPAIRYFYNEVIRDIGSSSTVVLITQDDHSKGKLHEWCNRLSLWRGASISYAESYLKCIFKRNVNLSNKNMCFGNDIGNERLTAFEWGIVHILASGVSLYEASAMMRVNYKTLCNYKYTIMKKLSVRNRSEFNEFLTAVAVRHHYI